PAVEKPAPRPKPAPADYPWLLTILAGLAILISVAALALAYLRTRDRVPQRRLSAYDFSTPEAALRSSYLMRDNRDHLAVLELEREQDGLPEGLAATLEIKKVVALKANKQDDGPRGGWPGRKDGMPEKADKDEGPRHKQVVFFSIR